MSEIKTAKTEPKELFWGTAEDTGFGMLGVEGSGQHMQPMTHFIDRDAKALWFITSLKTDLTRAVGAGAIAHFTLVSKGQDVQICARGKIKKVEDAAKRKELWNPVAGAWFEDQNDPALVLLKLDLEEASIWASTDSAFVFGWEIAKAHAKGEEPDVGTHEVIAF
ncbi:pyridoxamine 5'-phosphate oxidase family protein [Maritimibacter dapengensis]|uniref:Pyridoxamine 5'-phosphate oxidase family protein n=1 Tax=Maritimibacter dapengensis TaxID=2836868 RepID=A0ABS6T1I6_9RHOB|nr:pyridoxamine 5'-phosphate oxidase family protein [Maritimibacter dapengensis]MBV7378840.1 pyridoxamine 5'-phosphate oxidase family protein [Maritimibacter dapengensis]